MPAMKKQDATPSQSERFKQAARELGCDESEERFNEALKAVAKHKPKPLPAQPRRKSGA
jgi:hypothetical protein